MNKSTMLWNTGQSPKRGKIET